MILKRTVQKLVGADWVDIQSLYELEIGDKFRMFEKDGTPVTWGGVDNWLALDVVKFYCWVRIAAIALLL